MFKQELATACVAAMLLLNTGSAEADRHGEIGAFGGYHLFNDDNELGVNDAPDAEALEDAITFGVRAAAGLTRLLDIEGELAIYPSKSTDTSVDVVAFGWRAHALMHFTEGKFRPFALAGVGALTSSSEDERQFGSETDLAIHGGLGFKYQVQDNWGVRFDARLLLPPSSDSDFVTTDGEFLLGLYKSFGTVEKAPAIPLTDSDGDGVIDASDACPNEAEDLDGNDDSDGCPETEDSDGDGITDDKDACPNEAEDFDKHLDEDGCPELDNDEDGIADLQDACPMDAEDLDGFDDADGCPELDNDKDGILDANDKCADQAETKNGFEDADGCPDVVPESVKSFSGAIKGIRFKTGSAAIRPSSFTVLKKAVAVFTEFSALRVEIQGHTDSKGSDEINTKLSQDRAQAVADYLISKGIAADRLEAKGFGPSVPVADNTTKAGRDENRRVVFKLIN